MQQRSPLHEFEHASNSEGSIWNKELQSVFDRGFHQFPLALSSSEDALGQLDATRRMAALSNDFVHTARMYAEIIVTERHLPLSEKTVKPITKRIGGIAGGA